MAVPPRSADGAAETKRFAGLTFDRYRLLAGDSTLSPTEKIGCPDSFRIGFTGAILADVTAKLPALAGTGRAVLDIGIGCAELAHGLLDLCRDRGHHLTGVDSPEMLALLPDRPGFEKCPGRFPDVADDLARNVPGGFEAIIVYSVLQVVFVDQNPVHFVDRALALLAPGGRLLVGDVPNVSKLRRFLASAAGAAYHRDYMRTSEMPEVPAFAAPDARLDDGVLFGLMQRARNAGFEAYLVPQPDGLPLANRREDLLFQRP